MKAKVTKIENYGAINAFEGSPVNVENASDYIGKIAECERAHPDEDNFVLTFEDGAVGSFTGEEVEILEEEFVLIDEDDIKLNDEHSLVLFKDEEDEDSWDVCIMRTEDMKAEHFTEPGVAFAVEDYDTKTVEVTDHGLICQQYLSKEQREVIESFGLKIGEKFDSMVDFWKHCKSSAGRSNCMNN